MPNSKQYNRFTVKIGGQDTKPEAYTVLTISRSTGGRKVDSAVVAVERAPDLYLQKASARPAEIEQTLEIFNGNKRVFWGLIEDASYSWGDRPDDKTIVASIQPWAFGPPITHATYLVIEKRNYLGDSPRRVRVDEPIVFNGFSAGREEWTTREGKAFVGNKTAGRQFLGLTREGKNTNSRTALLIPLEAVQTDIGRFRYDNTFSPWARLDAEGVEQKQRRANASFEWTLRDAVEYVCVHGNDETFIANPTRAEIDKLPTLILPRTELAIGRYLPDYLDDLLKPYGWDWYVDVSSEGAGLEKPMIRFIQWGTGPEVSAKYAKVGDKADFATTNVATVDINYAISQSVNAAHVKGGRVLIEGTFELYRVGNDKWVLNEGADYKVSAFPTYKRPNTLEAKMDTYEVPVPELSSLAPPEIFGAFAESGFVKLAQRRRRFWPTITTGPSQVSADSDPLQAPGIIETRPIGPNKGYDIEILDMDGETWINIQDLEDPIFRHVRVLEEECGIVFDRGKPTDDESPDEIPENNFLESSLDIPRLRITAAIELDFCVQAVVERKKNQGVFSVARREHTWVWWDERRWPCRMRITSGRYATKYATQAYSNATPSPDQIVADMTRAGRAVLDRLDAARVNGTIVFNNLDEAVPLGGIIKTISGRDFSLLTRHSKDSPQFPQVVAVHYDTQAAIIVATLSSEPANSLEAFG